MKINIAICDDNKIFCNQLKEFIERYSHDNDTRCKVSSFNSGIELLEQYTDDYKIIILDIEMEGMNGIETALEIRKKNQKVIMWFLTVSEAYVMDGYKAEAFRYLIKPLSYEEFAEQFKESIKWVEEKYVTPIIVEYKNETYHLEEDDILFIEVYGHKLIYHLHNKPITTIDSLKNIETKLSKSSFVRIHRSYLINLKKVKTFNKVEIIMQNNEKVPISKYKEKEFKQAYTQFWGKILG
ncbi:LytR/AlgR family response regulator transcription factor [Candidatus Galacturonibacter soehngenii]|uniref:Stage 0 sporulation protein A homolog n=1 Tax=Candidatus Galacturonatibacter soehngenii TaxID=2307010 RepID=A0A7V7QP23_9FIRM|nr:LytTR family DNA-binding domain-containing protein [Candidatus Galacturonibacter soehngenii]KAB1441254.1 response regulator transcription factor [Candidatus Galacturonibacter soehngenii]MBA4688145.1 response regulator transcription factor [Candidatus Galacturonibacter soehngenii]